MSRPHKAMAPGNERDHAALSEAFLAVAGRITALWTRIEDGRWRRTGFSPVSRSSCSRKDERCPVSDDVATGHRVIKGIVA